MMIVKRLVYVAFTIAILFIALFIRSKWAVLPYFINFWIGDFLWAFMLYFLWRAIFLQFNRYKMTIALIVFCWLIEGSQAWHTPWLDDFRHTTIGGLLLGHGYLWSDILAYTAGVIVAYWADRPFDGNID
jgi:glycerol uptake facilitator-like aquaporin